MERSGVFLEGDSCGVEEVDKDNLTTFNSCTTNSNAANPPDQVQCLTRGRSVSSASPSLTTDSGLCSTSVSSSPTKEMSPAPVPVSLHQQTNERHSPTIQIAARHKIQQFKTDFEFGNDGMKLSNANEADGNGNGAFSTFYKEAKNNSSNSQCFDNSQEALNQENTAMPEEYSENRDDDVRTEEQLSLRQTGCESNDSESSLNMESDKKVYPMAFTVDFGESDSKKSLEITDSISKFAPRHHRRNLSLTKADETGAKEEQNEFSQTLSDSSRKTKDNNFLKKSSPVRNDSCFDTPAKPSANNSNSSVVPNGAKPTNAVNRNRLSNPSLLKRSPPPGEENKTRKSSSQNTKQVAMNARDIRNNNHLSNDQSPSKNADDNTSETGTYTVENESTEVRKARKVVDKAIAEDSNSNHEGTLGWVREWAEQASQQAISPESTPESETQCLLYDTENLVSAMQKRVSRNLTGKKSDGFNSEGTGNVSRPHTRQNGRFSKEKCSASSPLHREGSVLSDSGYALGYASDSSNDGYREVKNPVKYNRAFAIRRGRVVGYDSDNCVNRQGVTQPIRGVSPRPQLAVQGNTASQPSKYTSPAFSRTDGGRFSLRAPSKAKPKLPVQQQRESSLWQRPVENGKISSLKQPSPQPAGSLSRSPRSNSTLTAKEVELANWKRRKNYDPMKSAQSSSTKRKDFSGSRSDSPTDGLTQRNRPTLQMSPLAIHPGFPSSSRSHVFYNNNNASGNSEDEDSNELASTHSSSSPTNHLMPRSLYDETHSQLSLSRSKNKLEALDSLVIATIHSLSVKVRTCSRQLLEKLHVHYSDENGALLEEMVSQLKDLETSSSPAKSTSRELSGTLKNLKKIEQVILVLDRVLCEEVESDPQVN